MFEDAVKERTPSIIVRLICSGQVLASTGSRPIIMVAGLTERNAVTTEGESSHSYEKQVWCQPIRRDGKNDGQSRTNL